ncbi:MAG: hypothetical protein LBQ81_12225 [Zoogloeaceae bacterium]|jgi:hypothetical protein|nr:hypothetical protein [Zoogloeaceae bacterium]
MSTLGLKIEDSEGCIDVSVQLPCTDGRFPRADSLTQGLTRAMLAIVIGAIGQDGQDGQDEKTGEQA